MVEQSQERLTACLKCELVKPLDIDWPKFGDLLRRLRFGTRIALNDTVTDLVIANRTGRPTHDERPRQSYAYDCVKGANERSGCDMSGAMASVVSRSAFAAYQRYQKDVFKRKISRVLPSFGRNAPIFVRADNWRFIKDPDSNGTPSYQIECKLEPGRDSGWIKIAIGISGGSAHATARRLLDPSSQHKLGDLKIKYNERKRKWLGLIAYSFPKPEFRRGGMVAMHRGIRNMLYAVNEKAGGRTIMDGGDVLSHKLQMLARAKSLGRHRRELGSGAHGHGVRRRDAGLIKLRDKEERFTKTKMQQAAAAAVKFALANGAGVIVVEDYTTIEDDCRDKYAIQTPYDERPDIPWIVKRWAWAAQTVALQWASDKAGLEILRIPGEDSARTCPECGCVDPRNDKGKGTFKCVECGYTRPVDYVTSLNMLTRAQAVVKQATGGNWAIMYSDGRGGKKRKYLELTWLTKAAAMQALEDLLSPYPPDHEWRAWLSVEKVVRAVDVEKAVTVIESE